MESINTKLRRLRKERGLTLTDLAEKVGTDHQHISRIERGKSRLTVDFLLKLSDALDTPMEGIMDSTLKKEMAPQKKGETQTLPPNAMPSVNPLATILAKIEETSSKQQVVLNTREKAFLAAEIYAQSLKASECTDPTQIQHVFIDCAIALLESIYER